ncbi:hypothetical protein LTR05_007022 [Lithohypha guttulata]|uniref:Uncharacterized protein n=1 Tax=Lithohypha guttulata TaxID=1690604 RepID=A0AAN7Y9I2_9EURO|nr:hypothetical protein LTR05_007022 [Lithohypha guttulata]
MAPLESDAFFAACFRNLKEKPNVDFDKVAEETGMSVGGSKNKFRDLMKKLGVGEAGNKTDTEKKPAAKAKAKATEKAPKKTGTKRKAPAKKVEVPPTSDAEDEVEVQQSDAAEDGSEHSQPESPKKKQKTTKAAPALKKITKATKKPEAKPISPDSSEPSSNESSGESDIEMQPAPPRPGKKEPKPAATKKGTAKKVDKKKGAEVDDSASEPEPKKPVKEAPKKTTAPKGKAKTAKAKQVAEVEKEEDETKDDEGSGVEAAPKTKGKTHSRKPSKSTKDTEVKVNVPARAAPTEDAIEEEKAEDGAEAEVDEGVGDTVNEGNGEDTIELNTGVGEVSET